MGSILAYLAVCAVLSGAKGYGDAAFERARTPFDTWHLVTRGGLWLACLWPFAFALPPWWAIPIGAIGGIVGFWVGKRLGGKRWPSAWVPWLR